jgi:hypothetical protein
MSKPAHASTHPANDRSDPAPSHDEIDVVNEGDREYPAQRDAARAAAEVVERLLRRHAAP